jgi:RNA polymerase sigma-70 factor (ECF subfamily)
MRAARKGDAVAYRRLLVGAASWLRAVTGRGLAAAGRPREDCEDIVQETLLAMHLKRDTWDGTRPIEPWLRAIARHKLTDHLRRRGYRDHLDIDEWSDSAELSVEAEAATGMDTRRLLASLPERQRTIVSEISIEGRSAADVAASLGMSEGAVRVALHRALKSLATLYRRDPS